MPYFRRRSTSSRSLTSSRAASRYKRYYRRRYRRSYVPRPIANNSSRSRVSLRIPITAYISLYIPDNSSYSYVCAINPWTYNPEGSDLYRVCRSPTCLPASPLYRTYATLYDEVRIKGVYVKFSCPNTISGADSANFMFLEFHHMWDRKGTVYELRDSDSTAWETPPNPECHIPDARSLCASTLPSLAVENSIPKFTTKCVASDLLEKCTFHDCTVQANGNGYADAAYESDKVNVSYFSPVLYYCLRTDLVSTGPRIMTLVVTVDYYVEFRNPKHSPYTDYLVSSSVVPTREVSLLKSSVPSDLLSQSSIRDPTVVEDEDTKML